MKAKYLLLLTLLLFISSNCGTNPPSIEIIKNGDFSLWNKGNNANPNEWMLGGAAAGTVQKDTSIVKVGNSSVRITMISGEALALYQDIENSKRYRDKEFFFGCWIKVDTANSAYLALHDGISWFNSPPHTGSGGWEYLTARGRVSAKATKIRIHLMVGKNATACFNGVSLTIGPQKVFEEKGIEYLLWSGLYNTKIYRSKKAGIAMAFGAEQIMDGYVFQNFFIYDYEKLYDYFCVPDDLIIAYDKQTSFVTRISALEWKLEHGRYDNGQKAFNRYTFKEGAGFNPPYFKSVIFNSRSALPPARVVLEHTMDDTENFVPMKIAIRNAFDRPLRFLYVLQDGAYMTDAAEGHQEDVHQYWDDGEYFSARVWNIDKNKRHNNNNWVGMYNDRHGGMFAGTYAPPESHGIRYHATWDSEKPVMLDRNLNKPAACIDGYKTNSNTLFFWKDDWHQYERLLSHVDTPNSNNHYDNPYGKMHATVIDFGTIPPGEERVQIVVKIMFAGYRDRKDMHEKVRGIINRIPRFDISSYNLDREERR